MAHGKLVVAWVLLLLHLLKEAELVLVGSGAGSVDQPGDRRVVGDPNRLAQLLGGHRPGRAGAGGEGNDVTGSAVEAAGAAEGRSKGGVGEDRFHRRRSAEGRSESGDARPRAGFRPK